MLNTILSIPTYNEPSNALIVMNWVFIILVGLFVLLGLFVIIVSIGMREFENEIIMAIISTMVGIGMIVFLSFILHSQYVAKEKYPAWYESEIVEVQYENIYSLKLNNETSGHFCLGSGKIGTDSYYYFYIKNNHDAYQLTKLKVNDRTYLKESDESPKVVEKKDANSTEIYTLIYVPVGTVVTADFNAI